MILKLTHINKLTLNFGLALLPIYTFGSGGVQPTHAVLAIFACVVLISQGISNQSWLLFLFTFFLYTLLSESLHTLTGGDLVFMVNIVFLLFNLLLTAAIFQFVRLNGLSSVLPGMIIAAAVVGTSIFVGGVDFRELDEAGRETATFNNPNQLGYFSVCLLSMVYLFLRNGVIPYWMAIGLYSSALIMAVASLSKSAIISVLLVIILASRPNTSWQMLVGWLLGAFGVILITTHLFLIGALDEYLFVTRIMNMANESDSSFAARGYFAMSEGSLFQIFFGLGSDAVHNIVGREVHSTFGSVFNNYGLVGLLLFFTVWLIWTFRMWQHYGAIGMLCIVAPVLLYGIAHNGIRFTTFWILFSISMATTQKHEKYSEIKCQL